MLLRRNGLRTDVRIQRRGCCCILFYAPTSRRFALGASNACLVGENPTCSGRRCRDARVYGHTTTARHDIEYMPSIEYTPPPSFPDLFRRMWVVATVLGLSSGLLSQL